LTFTSFGSVAVPGDSTVDVGANCDPLGDGRIAVSSGWEIGSPGPGIPLDLIDLSILTNRQRLGDPAIWDFKVRNNSAADGIFSFSVGCLDI
jgi:hypothetical protein